MAPRRGSDPLPSRKEIHRTLLFVLDGVYPFALRTFAEKEMQPGYLVGIAQLGATENPLFVTDKQEEGGTGLGLSVTYGLVQAHGGDIFFETRRGKGTTFTISMPTLMKREAAKILIVDDDRTIREMLIEALTAGQQKSYLIEEASNGIEASIKLGTYRPDLLILDLFMPEMDGLEVCRIIRNEPELSDMKVIISTGYPDHGKLEEMARLGFTNVIFKPFNLPEFVRKVERILATG